MKGCVCGVTMATYIVVGGFFGDEGKGKILAHLALSDSPRIIARGGVGPNAGHTVEYRGKKYGLRTVPSGFVNESARLLVGAGVLVDPQVFLREVRELNLGRRVGLDRRCGIIEPKHIEMDRKNKHLSDEIGTTGTGTGPANADRVMRVAKLAKDIPELRDYLTDVPLEINEAIDRGEDVLIEGTQGFGISLYYGTYPYVTSKDTTASQVACDVGIGPTKVDEVVVVFKSYPTRVGEGPFPTEISQEEAKRLGIQEFGTVTRRPRRVGLWDGEMARYSAMINGATQIALTGVDRVDPECRDVKEYSKLTPKAKKFIEKVEEDTRTPVTIISTGPSLESTIDLRHEKL